MIIIALGANVPGPQGSPQETLNAALRAFGRKGIAVKKTSRRWLSQPVPVSDHPWYTNAVTLVETNLRPRQLFNVLKALETEFGRVPGERNAPRPLDLDLIAYHDELITEKDLTVPHPRAHERAFVLHPLQEILPEWKHPGLKKSLHDLIQDLPPGQKAEPLEDAA